MLLKYEAKCHGLVLSFCFTVALRGGRQLVQAAARQAERTFPVGLPDQNDVWSDSNKSSGLLEICLEL